MPVMTMRWEGSRAARTVTTGEGTKEGKREVSRALFVRACAICPSPTQRVPLPNSAPPRPRFLLPAGAMGGGEGRVVRARSPGLPARRSRGREDRPQSSGVAVCAPASQAGLVTVQRTSRARPDPNARLADGQVGAKARPDRPIALAPPKQSRPANPVPLPPAPSLPPTHRGGRTGGRGRRRRGACWFAASAWLRKKVGRSETGG